MAEVYVVPKGDQYVFLGEEVFRFVLPRPGPRPNTPHTRVCRDYPKDFSRLRLGDLRLLAEKIGIKGRSSMRKAELLAAVSRLIRFE